MLLKQGRAFWTLDVQAQGASEPTDIDDQLFELVSRQASELLHRAAHAG